jgi:hypothetical protein
VHNLSTAVQLSYPYPMPSDQSFRIKSRNNSFQGVRPPGIWEGKIRFLKSILHIELWERVKIKEESRCRPRGGYVDMGGYVRVGL